jgi:hypothetical protein
MAPPGLTNSGVFINFEQRIEDLSANVASLGYNLETLGKALADAMVRLYLRRTGAEAANRTSPGAAAKTAGASSVSTRNHRARGE